MIHLARLVSVSLVPFALAQGVDPCSSGPGPGERPKPYSFLVATGPKRGQAHCFICETGDRPAVIVFARSVHDPLGRLLVRIDEALVKHRDANVRAWATFLSDQQPDLDPQLAEWARRLGLRGLPLGVFADSKGPPSYQLNPDADVTVLLSVKQKVVANFAFRKGELDEKKAQAILAELPQILRESSEGQ